MGMFERATIVSDIFLVVLAGIVTAFTALFGILIWNATINAGNAGFGSMFTSYGYVTIEVTFLCMILVGAYQVFRVGLRRWETEPDEDYDLIESDG